MNKPALPSSRLNKSFLGLSFILILFFISTKNVFAGAIYFDVAPPPGSTSVAPSFCGQPAVCANSHNTGNCGLPTCSGGNDWYKYYLTCVEVIDPFTGQVVDYNSHYQQGEAICSIGDKCVAGEEGLRPGYCSCDYGISRYKVCCSGTSTNICENAAASLQDNDYPPEGQCPGGAANEKFCGFGSYPACDDPFICGGSPITCNYNRTYNECCSNGVSRSITEYTWSDGSGVCNSVAGSCNQSDPACITSTPSPTPTPIPCVCTPNAWDSNLCARCKTDCSGYNNSCTDFGPNSPSPGNDWCSCDQRCPGADNPACAPSFTVSCSASPNPVNINQSVTWSASPNPTGTYTYSWSGAVSGSGQQISVPSGYSTSGTKTANITATRTSDGVLTTNSCPLTVNPAGTLTPNTSSACNATNTAQTISASWNNIGAASYQPDLKDGSGGSVGGINCVSGSTTSFNFPGTYSLTGSYTAYVTAFSGAGCVGIITTASKTVTNAVCTATPTPTPTPAPVGCSLTINGLTGTGSVSGSVGTTFNISSVNPATPYYISVEGGNLVLPLQFGPYSSNPGTATWSTSGRQAATYTVSNGCMSRNINLGAISCSSTYEHFDIYVNTFFEPLFEPAQWPQRCWYSNSGVICGNKKLAQVPSQTNLASLQAPQMEALKFAKPILSTNVNLVKLLSQNIKYAFSQINNFLNLNQLAKSRSNLAVRDRPQTDGQTDKEGGVVLAGESCRTNGNCPSDGNICTDEVCSGYQPAIGAPYPAPEKLGVCQSNPGNYGLFCKVSPLGGSQYCDGTYNTVTSTTSPNGICSDLACKSNADCADANLCTNDTCSGYQAATGGPYPAPEKLGHCSSYTYGNICGTSPLGGNMYCGYTNSTGGTVGDGICYDTSCKSNPDCDDNNVCTNDTCDGYQAATGAPYYLPEKLGMCTNSNKRPWTVCQTDGSGNPLKLCSEDPVSTCSTTYVQCNNTNANDSNCCGLTNKQIMSKVKLSPPYTGYSLEGSCQYAPFGLEVGWNYDSDHPFNNPLDNPVSSLPNVTVYIQNDCGLVQSQLTDANGRARFRFVPYAKGSSSNFTELNYTVWADVPANHQFTRGVYYSSNSSGLQSNSPPRKILGPGGTPKFTGVNSSRYLDFCDAFGCNYDFVYRYLNFGFSGPPVYKIAGTILRDAGFNACLSGSSSYSGATLSATNLSSSSTLSATSGINGAYSITNLSPAGYALNISNFTGQIVAIRINGVWISTSSSLVSPLSIPPSQTVDFCINTVPAWFKTSGGDVHSNTLIDTPGGP